jgi:prolyl 4-hydroxylase
LACTIGAAERRLLRLQQLTMPLQMRLIDPISAHRPSGYELTALPAELQRSLEAFVDAALANNVGVPFHDHIIYGRTTRLPLPRSLAEALRTAMLPKLEAFCGCTLRPGGIVHGVRIYHAGARLVPHLDWPHAWVVSATINVRRNASLPAWPLELRGRGIDGAARFTHGEGEAVMYEGSRLLHGRPEPLRDGVYAAAFLGFSPVGYPDVPSAGTATRAIVASMARVMRLGYWLAGR